MAKRFVYVATIALLVSFAGPGSVIARSKAEKQAIFAAKVRAGILKLGVGESARVKLKLRDGSKLNGYVSEAADNLFVVTDAETGASATVEYAQVSKVQGHNLSTGAKIAIGLGVAVAVLVILLILENTG